MTNTEHLIDIVNNSLTRSMDESCNIAKNIVNDLISEGVIFTSCKIGDTVYRVGDSIKKVYEFSITCIEIFDEDYVVFYDDRDNEFTQDDIGKTVFLTREEAEKSSTKYKRNVKLPCDIGAKCFVLNYFLKDAEDIMPATIVGFGVYEDGMTMNLSYTGENISDERLIDDIGKSVFFTKREAEKALKEMK